MRLPALVTGSCAILLIVAGCAAPAPTGPSSPDPTPTATSTPVVDRDPTPFVDATCADLLPLDAVTAAVIEPVQALAIAEYRELSWVDVPRGAAVRQLGGFTCEWNNGVKQADDLSVPDYRGIYLSVLPEAASEWPRFEANVDPATGRAEDCNAYDGVTHCVYDALVGSTWIHISVDGATGPDAYRPLATAVEAALAAAPPATETWAPPAGALPTALDCATLDSVASPAFGSPSAPTEQGGGWSQEASSWSIAGILGTNCLLVYEVAGGASSVDVTAYAGAGWALAEAQQAGFVPTQPTSTTPSMESSDSAWISCATDALCTAHVLVAEGWVRVDIRLADGHAAIDGSALAETITETVVAQVRG